jgi:hypothetical protein
MHSDLPRGYVTEHVFKTLHVESFLQYFAIRLNQDGEAGELAHCLQQVQRFESLQPQWHPPARVTTWE